MSAPTFRMPGPALIRSMASSAWAWRIHPRIVVFPSALVGDDTDLVVDVGSVRSRLDLLMYAPEIGLALAWCREDLGLDIVPIPYGQSPEEAWIHPAYPPVGKWMRIEDAHLDHACWTLSEQGGLCTFYPKNPDSGTGTRLADWLTPGLLKSWDQASMASVWMCLPCGILEATVDRSRICASCGQGMSAGVRNIPGLSPAVHTIEAVIRHMGVDPVLCRIGPMAWQLRRGSAEMVLRYAPDEASLCVDVHLVRIGAETARLELYQYLLQENMRLDSFGFSIQDDLVMISLVVPDRAILEIETAGLLIDLLEKSDEYDNHLVSVFQALWL